MHRGSGLPGSGSTCSEPARWRHRSAPTVTASSGYDRVAAALWVFRHLGDLFLLVVGAPLIASLLLAYEAARGASVTLRCAHS